MEERERLIGSFIIVRSTLYVRRFQRPCRGFACGCGLFTHDCVVGYLPEAPAGAKVWEEVVDS